MKAMKNLWLSLCAFLAVAAMPVLAEVPTGVTTELTTAKTDVSTIGVAVFAVIVAIAIFKWFRRAL
jgi:hypothetical protein